MTGSVIVAMGVLQGDGSSTAVGSVALRRIEVCTHSHTAQIPHAI